MVVDITVTSIVVDMLRPVTNLATKYQRIKKHTINVNIVILFVITLVVH